MIERPQKVLFTAVILIVLLFGVSVHIFEIGQLLVNSKTRGTSLLSTLDDPVGSFWLIIMSLFTVGYGDVIP
jgi:hypothetical protein